MGLLTDKVVLLLVFC